MLNMNLQMFAHKKGVGSTKNGRDHLASCWMNVKEIYEAQEGGSNEQ